MPADGDRPPRSGKEAEMNSREFVAGLVAEMDQLFSQLGETDTLTSESQGNVDVVTLLRLALKSEMEASELAALWLPSTPELEARMCLALQCGDEMKHYAAICQRLSELGSEVPAFDPPGEGRSPLYHYLRGLRTTVERIAGGPFASEAIAQIRNAQFVRFCRDVGDERTAELYEKLIQPEEAHHHQLGREVLERYAQEPEQQELAAAAARNTLAIADELSNLAARTTGTHHIPTS
jgi:1,2-phenylacetyl-CoA epoxidase catalytic subunit